MKAIQINANHKNEFLQACKKLHLEPKQMKSLDTKSSLFFKVSKPDLSQNDLFLLGIYYSILFEQNIGTYIDKTIVKQ